jgi:hypothetical protein
MDATDSAELRDILRHNRDEEKEHAAMVLEWIRRHDPAFDTKLREYLFTEGDIVGREAELERQASTGDASNGNAGTRASVGSLRGGR